MKNPTNIIKHLPKPLGTKWLITPDNDVYHSYTISLITPHKRYTRSCSLGRYDKVSWMKEWMFIDVASKLLAEADPNRYPYNDEEKRHQFYLKHRKLSEPND